MDRIRASSKTISFRNWRRPSGAAGSTITGSADAFARPKTSRYRTGGGLSLNPLLVDNEADAAHGAEPIAETRLPPMPTDTCMVLKYLVDFLIKSKLHKSDLFVADAKLTEKAKLLQYILEGELPERLSHYSSRSVSHAVLHTITHTFAPIFPHDCHAELVRLLSHDRPLKDQVEYVARVVQWNLSAERRALFESLLLLLHKLSLKATHAMNATVLGELVASKLVGHDSAMEHVSTPKMWQPSVGKFLVENAPNILRHRQALARSHSGALSVNDVGASSVQWRRHVDARVVDRAGRIISRDCNPGEDTTDVKSDLARDIKKRPLDQHVARRVSVVLTTIIDSTQSKLRLFTTSPRDTIAMQFLREGVFNSLSSCDDLDLASGLRDFLLHDVEPLLGDLVLCCPANVGVDSAIASDVVDHLQDLITQQLEPFVQDVVVLLLAAVRLAMDAGTDMELLTTSLAPCLFSAGNSDNERQQGEVCCRILFSEMQTVLLPLMSQRARKASARQMAIAIRVVVWVAKCRVRARQAQRCRQEALLPWSEPMALSLCDIVKMLLDQTHAYPSQARRLYLDGGDEMEILILVERLCVDGRGISAEMFAPHSAALAVRRVLTSAMKPLVGKNSKAQTRLKQLLLAHLDVLLRLEKSDRVRCELENAFDDMLYGQVHADISDDKMSASAHNKEPQVGELQLHDSSDSEECREAVLVDSALEEAPMRHVACTFSEWLASISEEDAIVDTPARRARTNVIPPMGFTLDSLEVLQHRLDDIFFVIEHSCSKLDVAGSRTGLLFEESNQSAWIEARTRLVTVLDSLHIPSVLVPRHRATSTLTRLQTINVDSKVPSSYSVTPSRLVDLEIIETLVLEALSTLRHPMLTPLYPTVDDQLLMLLDVWGLGDRSIALAAPTPQLRATESTLE